MAEKGKALSSGSGSGPKRRKEKRTSRSVKADLIFPVGRMERALKAGKHAERVSAGAPIYLAAGASEVLELAGTAAVHNKKHRITPHHIHLAVSCDGELSELFSKAIIPAAGPPLPSTTSPAPMAASNASSAHHHHHHHHQQRNLD